MKSVKNGGSNWHLRASITRHPGHRIATLEVQNLISDGDLQDEVISCDSDGMEKTFGAIEIKGTVLVDWFAIGKKNWNENK